jgi:hypothetical protein
MFQFTAKKSTNKLLRKTGVHQMSDPKTSQNNEIVFQDRLAVVGNASFICLLISAVWTVLFIGNGQISLSTLIFLAAPLIATGSTVLIGAFFKDLVPKPVVSKPLNCTVPIIWCTVCFLVVFLIATQETGSTRVPEALLPVLVWSKWSNLVPVLFGQIAALTLVVILTKEKT